MQAGAAAADAMEQVLRAERAAELELQHARAEAAQSVERARDEARALVNRTLERTVAWQGRHARALLRRVEAMQARAAAAEGAADPAPGLLERAVERLAAQLTGDDGAA